MSIHACISPTGPAASTCPVISTDHSVSDVTHIAAHQALVVEPAHENVDAFVDFAEHVLLRNFAILEDQLRGISTNELDPHTTFSCTGRGADG
jgi:hypothetical protein